MILVSTIGFSGIADIVAVVWPKNISGFAVWVTYKMAAILPKWNTQSVPFFDIFEADL